MADPHPFADGLILLVVFFVAAFVLGSLSNFVERLVTKWRRRRDLVNQLKERHHHE